MTDSALKWANESRDLIEGMLAPYGGPIAGKDLDGEFFSTNTDFSLEWFGDWQRPLIYSHGKDAELGTSVVGRIKVEQTDKGLWMQAQLDKANAYYDAIAGLVDQKALGLSSGSMPHLIRKNMKTGELVAWPLIEGSLTPMPANPDARAGYAVKSTDAVEHLAALGVEAPEALKYSEAADDVSEASMVRGCLTQLLAEETGEGDQETILRRAIALIDRFIASETAEIGTPEDQAASGAVVDSEDAAVGGKSMDHQTVTVTVKADTAQFLAAIKEVEAAAKALTPQSLHDAALASGAKCASETPEPEPAPLLAIAGKSAETEPAVDLEALKARLSAEAVRQARELVGR